MYRSIRTWRDLEDKHLYHTGDIYPHDGREVPAERIAELSSKRNKAGFAMIEALPVPAEENPIQTEEPPKKATRGRKKAG